MKDEKKPANKFAGFFLGLSGKRAQSDYHFVSRWKICKEGFCGKLLRPRVARG
jgi:hypothetical protein